MRCSRGPIRFRAALQAVASLQNSNFMTSASGLERGVQVRAACIEDGLGGIPQAHDVRRRDERVVVDVALGGAVVTGNPGNPQGTMGNDGTPGDPWESLGILRKPLKCAFSRS